MVGCKKVRKKTLQARHFVMRNSIFIGMGSPKDWRNEMKLEVKGEVRVICDALFTIDERYHIVEADNSQRMNVNRAKITKYKKLIELGVFKKQPKFVWITTTDYRRKELLKICEGLDVTVFTVDDFI